VLNKQVYEVAKVLAAIVLPAFAAFYITLAQSWGWGHTDAVVATVTAVATLLGVLVKTMPPIDGVVKIIPGADLDDPDKFDINLQDHLMDPSLLEKQKLVRLKVVQKQAA
jgi:hypothetical protein